MKGCLLRHCWCSGQRQRRACSSVNDLKPFELPVQRPFEEKHPNLHCGCMHELGADWFSVSTGHGQFHLCISGPWRRRKEKKMPKFFSPREGAAPLRHLLHGQTLSLRRQTKMALQRPSHFAQTEALERWQCSSVTLPTSLQRRP